MRAGCGQRLPPYHRFIACATEDALNSFHIVTVTPSRANRGSLYYAAHSLLVNGNCCIFRYPQCNASFHKRPRGIYESPLFNTSKPQRPPPNDPFQLRANRFPLQVERCLSTLGIVHADDLHVVHAVNLLVVHRLRCNQDVLSSNRPSCCSND